LRGVNSLKLSAGRLIKEGTEWCTSQAIMKGKTWMRNNKSGGFTLLEVMMAISIIAIALTAVLGSQSQSVALAGEARFKTTAPLLAQNKMAEMEAMNPVDLASDSGDFGDDFPGYTWTVTVDDVMFDGSMIGSDYLKQIDLTVSWGQGEMYQYNLRLYRFFLKK